MGGSRDEIVPVEGTRRHARRRRRRQRAGTIALGVGGELLLTAGAFVLLFLGWQLYVDNAVARANQTAQAIELEKTWSKAVGSVPKEPAGDTGSADVPVLAASLKNKDVFATLIVPRFGEDFTRTIAEGVGRYDVLDKFGVGHYPDSALPGEVGNMALASHRTTKGASFRDIDLLDVGDSIYIETQDGWYRYVYRSHEVVVPTDVDVLADVPRNPGMASGTRYLTLTTCNPKWSMAERFIAYAIFDSFQPRSAGAPAEIAHLYQGAS